MALIMSEEQEALVEAVRGWLADHTTLERAKAEDPILFALEDLAAPAALGLTGLLRDGGTHADLALVAEELGRAGSPLPLGQAALVCAALDELGLAPALADEIAEGRILAVPALPDPDGAPITAEQGPDGSLVLRGTAPFVVGGASAALFLVAAVGPEGIPVLALVEALAQRRTSIDLTRDIASVEFAATPVAAGRWHAADHTPITDAVALHLAADALGAASRLLDMTVRYVKERRQFGRVIGGFQAVKHHCAGMALDVESSRELLRYAAEEPGDRVRVASAVSYAKDACSRVAGMALQLHGGMGFTWEHDVHLFLRRVKADELLGGTPREHRERLVTLTV
ncbi:alkylation response protein AidB-like acyl-CoA dehydrogenase [Actinocorallia herbida]|uniref:Alkylation response protein AidB-like acyl-CoA dehydrogenase n=1 Tax=Actinocorallia herbida TaxID=58109 RepID=A0A3N1D347_9ACTN|nr:acyl-CoA dehydrogenase family protein [Actinocorallia herbida]ROO87920.1 alkylation response protein AidB-like acyl-CoA dehydrogenase [Actinocorallia herbida]